MTRIHTYALAGLAAAAALAVAAPALAARPDACAKPDAGTSRALSDFQACGNALIQERVTDLGSLSTRISQMNKVSQGTKDTLAASISSQITAMQTLEGQIAAATDTPTVKPLIASITKNYRIYGLFRPQVHVAAATDRLDTIYGLLNSLENQLQLQVNTAATKYDVSAMQASLNDMVTKMQNASSSAQQALGMVINLKPDQGDQTVLASNKAAIQQARTLIDGAVQAVQAAQADAKSVRQALRALNTPVSPAQ